MPKYLAAIIISLLSILLGVVVNSGERQSAQTLGLLADTARVMQVVDGDTLKVQTQTGSETIRLIGVDTPELHHPSKPVGCYAQQAAAWLERQVIGKLVRLEADTTQDERDKYGRLLRYVYLGETLINLELLTSGYAFEYTYKIPYAKQAEFIAAESTARRGFVGLWGTVCDYSQLPANTDRAYACNCSLSCQKITTCDEAYYQLNSCGCKKLDGDGDGKPCANLCR